MPSLQYVIDSICSSVTVDCVYKIIDALLSQGPVTLAEVLPLIRSKDRSLDMGSARLIAQTALDDMAQRGLIRMEGDHIYPASASVIPTQR
jgi:hypothetical protein